MSVQSILEKYHSVKNISDDIISQIQNDRNLRKEMVHYFANNNQDREFAIALLDKFIFIRKQPGFMMPFEDLMFACYILGLHKQVEDSIKIWHAKMVDFDTHCGLDIQLVSFAGLTTTLDFLIKEETKEAQEAARYILSCLVDGDLDPTLEQYFSIESLPWYI